MIRLSKFWFYSLVLAFWVNSVGLVYFAIEGGKYRKMSIGQDDLIKHLEDEVLDVQESRDFWHKQTVRMRGMRGSVIETERKLAETEILLNASEAELNWWKKLARSREQDVKTALSLNYMWR